MIDGTYNPLRKSKGVDEDITFIDKRGILNHLVHTGDNLYVSYENVLKNSSKLNPWHSFNIKLFARDGTDNFHYCNVTKEIFRTILYKLTKRFNPELLI